MMNIESELADPATSPERLAAIVYAHPEHCAEVAAHPNCYDGLRDWIAQYHGVSGFSADADANTNAARADAAAPDAAVEAAVLVEAAEPARPKPGPRKRLLAIGAVVAPIITVAAVVIPLTASMTERQTSDAALQVSDDAKPTHETIGSVADSDKEFVSMLLPTDAPITGFPLAEDGESSYCTDEQLGWLIANGVVPMGYEGYVGRNSLTLTLRNTASTGGALSLSDLRFEGEEVNDVPFYISFSCPFSGGATGGGQLALLSSNGAAAVYTDGVYNEALLSEDRQPPGSPVTVNLDPGEVTDLKLVRDRATKPTKMFTGRVMAESSTGATVILADSVTLHPFPVDGFQIRYSRSDDTLSCKQQPNDPETYEFAPCTVAEAETYMRQAAEAAQAEI